VGLTEAGAVSVLYGSAGGVTASGGQLFTQDSPGVPGDAEQYDYFGMALGGLGTAPAAASPTAASSIKRLTASAR
jgi:hypothetical protein